ncbi:MAG TPA: hypothetical protein VK324_02625 [Tepidisphaeraceae bacterium]|nr:hypothetical protein [Tepidisphaeraceae bacterium]
MADETTAAAPSTTPPAALLRGIDWREAFPFTHLFRAFRIAVHPSKLLLSLILLLGIYTGGRVLDGVWPAAQKYWVPAGALAGDVDPLPARPDGRAPQPGPGYERTGPFAKFLDFQTSQVNNAAVGVLNLNWLGGNLARGGPSVLGSVLAFLVVGPWWLIGTHPVFAALFGIWFFLLWSVFGGAIARIAAVHVARDEKISVRQALRFSTGKVLSFFFAPVIPLLIVLALGALLALGGLLLYVPVVGPIAVGALLVLGLAVGFVITLVVLGTIGGFNLMYPTVAVEGSDSFDAISRSFSYVFAKPWRMLWYTLVALVYGAITYLFVRLFVWLVLLLTHQFVGWWLGPTTQPHAYFDGVTVQRDDRLINAPVPGAPPASIWPRPGPSPLAPLPYDVQYERLAWSEKIAAGLISFWTYLTMSVLGAYAISYYFSANTLIYALLRREVDATDLDDVYVEQADEEFAEPAPAAPSPAGPATAAGDAPPADPTAAPGTAKVYDAPESTKSPEATPPPTA